MGAANWSGGAVTSAFIAINASRVGGGGPPHDPDDSFKILVKILGKFFLILILFLLSLCGIVWLIH